MLYDEQGRLHFLVDKYSQTVVQLHYDQQHPKRVSKASRVFLKAGENPSIERNKTLSAIATHAVTSCMKCWTPPTTWSAVSPTPPRAT